MSMTDYDAYFRLLDRQSRRDRRERLHQQLAVVKAAQAAGFPVRSAVIEGVPLTFSQPKPAKAGGDHSRSQAECSRPMATRGASKCFG